MTTTERPERSVPKPASSPTPRRVHASSPTPAPSARRYNYFKPAKRKQTHYEDVTVDVQPDPRHYLVPGLDLRLRQRSRRLPAALDEAQGVGRRQARARSAAPAAGGLHVQTGPPTAGTSSATRTRSGSRPSTATTRTSSGRSTRTSRTPATPRRSTCGPTTGCTSSSGNVGAWMHIEHILGLYVFALATSAPARRTCTTPRWSSTARTRSGSPRTSRCTTSP